MSKTECPICGSYSSTITAGLLEDRKCPICGTSEDTILEMEEIERKKKYYKSQKIQDELINENEELKKELAIKRDRYNHFKDAVWDMFYKIEELKKDLDELWMNRAKYWDDETK